MALGIAPGDGVVRPSPIQKMCNFKKLQHGNQIQKTWVAGVELKASPQNRYNWGLTFSSTPGTLTESSSQI